MRLQNMIYSTFLLRLYYVVRTMPYCQFNQNYVPTAASCSSASQICFLQTAAEAGGCESKSRWNMLNLLELLCEIGRFAQLWFALIYFYS